MWKYFNQYTFSPTKLLATISSWTLGISGDFAYKLWKKLEWYCIYDILEIESIFDDMWWPKSCYLASNYIDFKRLIIKLFVAMILHIFVCCTSLCFSTRPQKVQLFHLFWQKSCSSIGLHFFSCLKPSYFKCLSIFIHEKNQVHLSYNVSILTKVSLFFFKEGNRFIQKVAYLKWLVFSRKTQTLSH